MIHTLQRRTGALFALLLAVLLSISLVGPALAATPDSRDDYALGRYADTNDWGDFSTPLTQSLAILALHQASDTEPSDNAVDLLVAQQCEDGGFPDSFRAPSTGDPAPCTSGVDTTALAVQALDAVGVDAAVQAAADWLVDVQGDDGEFGAEDGLNSNSTGLAAVALELGGYTEEADAARDWIIDLQDGCGSETPGAIPFNEGTRGAVELSTSQALLGMVDPAVGLADLDATAVTGEPASDCDTEGQLGDPVVEAVTFLSGLVTEDAPYVTFPDSDVPNVGGTIDVLFGFAAAGTGETPVERIREWLPGQAASYTQDGEGGAGAGATAKLALALLIADEDPRAIQAIDLIEQLEALEVTELPEVTVACDGQSVEPGDDVSCTISGLLAFETVDVQAERNPTLFEGAVSADGEGDADFAFSIPDDATEDGEVTITVDGLGADGLAGLTLRVSVPETEEIDEPAEEEDEETLPETGTLTAWLSGLGGVAVLLGAALLRVTRRTRLTAG